MTWRREWPWPSSCKPACERRSLEVSPAMILERFEQPDWLSNTWLVTNME